MAGPWEKYGGASVSNGPWSRYAASEDQTPIQGAQTAMGQLANALSSETYMKKAGVPEMGSITLPTARSHEIKYLPQGGVEHGPEKVGNETITGRNVLGGLVDTVLQAKLLKFLGGGAAATGELAGKKAEDLIISHLKPTVSQKVYLGPEGLRSVARDVLESGATGNIFGTNTAGTARNLRSTLKDIGQSKEAMIGVHGSEVNPELVANRLQNEVINPLAAKSATSPLAEQMTRVKNDFLSKYAPGLTEESPGVVVTSQGTPGRFVEPSPQVGRTVVTSPGTPGGFVEPVPQSGKTIVQGGYPVQYVKDASGLFTSEVPGKPVTSSSFSGITQFDPTYNPAPAPEFVNPKPGTISTYSSGLPGTFDPTYNVAPPVEWEHGTSGSIKSFKTGGRQFDPVYNPRPKYSMSTGQIDAEKMASQGMTNYKQGAPSAQIKADRAWDRILKEETERSVAEPNFPEVNRQYGNLKNASNWANRAEMLPGTRPVGGWAELLRDKLYGSRATTTGANVLNNISSPLMTAGNAVQSFALPFSAWLELQKRLQGGDQYGGQ